MHGARHRHQQQLQAEGITVAADLALVQFQLVQHRAHLLDRHAVLGHIAQRIQYQCLDRLRPAAIAALEAAAEHDLAVGVLQAAQRRGRAAELSGLQRLLQRRGAVVEQDAVQQVRLQQVLEAGRPAEQPAEHDVALLLGLAFLLPGVVLLDRHRRGIALLVGHRDVHRQGLEACQRARLETLVQLGHREVAVAHEHRVARVIVRAVELAQPLVAQVRDVLRIAARVVVVGGVREQVLRQRLPQRARDRAHRALHLVVHHALELQRRGRVRRCRELEAVAFLRKIVGIEAREEHRVEVDVEQVEEVLAVLAREGVGGPVAAGERVHEGVQRAARHHEEGVAHGVLLATAQRGVLQDVRHPGGVPGHRAQRHQEHIFRIVGRDMEMLRAGDAVAVFLDHGAQRHDRLAAHPFEGRVDGRGGGAGGRHLDTVHAGWSTSGKLFRTSAGAAAGAGSADGAGAPALPLPST